MNATRRERRRRELISYPSAQLRMIGALLVVTLSYVAMTIFIGLYGFLSLSDNILLLPLAESDRSDVVILIRQHASMIYTQLAISTFVSVFVFLVGGVYLSHKIAGPVHRIRTYLRDLADGRTAPQRIRLRKYDFFADLAESLNRFQEKRNMIPAADAAQQPAAQTAPHRDSAAAGPPAP